MNDKKVPGIKSIILNWLKSTPLNAKLLPTQNLVKLCNKLFRMFIIEI